MNLLPDAAQVEDAQVHDHLAAFGFPGHARTFQALRERKGFYPECSACKGSLSCGRFVAEHSG
jgi:hypothetical protein